MAISVIRKATDGDFGRVATAAIRFCKRDNQITAVDSIEYWIEYESHPEEKAYRRGLWASCFARAVREPVRVNLTIAHGYVGLSV